MEMEHISKMSTCDTLSPMKVGDKWKLRTYYDYTKHPGMLKTTGKPADVMGISLMYVAVPVKKVAHAPAPAPEPETATDTDDSGR